MPETELIFFCEDDRSVPFFQWLGSLPEEGRDRCVARLQLLEEFGHELRRPHAENLGDGLYELRIKFVRVNYRILYFFHGRTAAVVSHGLAKERTVPAGELKLAKARMEAFKAEPERHSFRPDVEG